MAKGSGFIFRPRISPRGESARRQVPKVLPERSAEKPNSIIALFLRKVRLGEGGHTQGAQWLSRAAITWHVIGEPRVCAYPQHTIEPAPNLEYR